MVRTGEDIKISIHNARLGFTVLIGEVLTSSRFKMKIVNILQVVSHERRNYFRVEVEMKGYLAKEKSRLGENDEDAFPVVVRDLSLCGLRFESTKDLELDSVYWTQIDIDGVRFTTEFRIARKRAMENTQRYAYGGEFVQERNPDTDKLCSYLFKKQREMAKRNQ